MYRDIATTLYKRGEASMDGYEMPGWAWGVLLVNAIVFLPLYFIVCITRRVVWLWSYVVV